MNLRDGRTAKFLDDLHAGKQPLRKID